MNSITDLLDLEDNDVVIKNIDVQGQTKVLTLETPPTAHFCPVCGFRMYSRGVKERTINHPILQDNYSLVLILKLIRKCRCGSMVLIDTNVLFIIIGRFCPVESTMSHLSLLKKVCIG